MKRLLLSACAGVLSGLCSCSQDVMDDSLPERGNTKASLEEVTLNYDASYIDYEVDTQSGFPWEIAPADQTVGWGFVSIAEQDRSGKGAKTIRINVTRNLGDVRVVNLTLTFGGVLSSPVKIIQRAAPFEVTPAYESFEAPILARGESVVFQLTGVNSVVLSGGSQTVKVLGASGWTASVASASENKIRLTNSSAVKGATFDVRFQRVSDGATTSVTKVKSMPSFALKSPVNDRDHAAYIPIGNGDQYTFTGVKNAYQEVELYNAPSGLSLMAPQAGSDGVILKNNSWTGGPTPIRFRHKSTGDISVETWIRTTATNPDSAFVQITPDLFTQGYLSPGGSIYYIPVSGATNLRFDLQFSSFVTGNVEVVLNQGGSLGYPMFRNRSSQSGFSYLPEGGSNWVDVASDNAVVGSRMQSLMVNVGYLSLPGVQYPMRSGSITLKYGAMTKEIQFIQQN